MTEVASRKANRRPPSAGGAAPRDGDKTQSPVTAELLRRRLAQAESQLREMEEEAQRVASVQSREMQVVQNEQRVSLDKVEVLRMEECMTPAELAAIRADAVAAKATDSVKRGQTAVDSKLLASRSAKYRQEREKIQQKRTECAEAEARLAAARSKLMNYRNKRQHLRRDAEGSLFAASVRKSRVAHIQSQSREQLRGLEQHVAMEQERLSSMIADAKKLRAQIDTLLIAQSRFEKSYRKSEDELLEKKKQMSFIIEVCTLLFEEREQKRREIDELRTLSREENKKYETALEELEAVMVENKRSQADLEEKIADTRKSLHESQKQRHAIEKANRKAEKDIQAKKAAAKAQQHSLSESPSRASPESLYSTQNPHKPPRRLNDVDGGAEDNEHSSADELANTGQNQIHQFDLFYQRLAELAGSDRLDDVVSYIDISAEERFGFFSELNYLRDETAKLEAEKAHLLGRTATTAEKDAVVADEEEEDGDRPAIGSRPATDKALRVQRAAELQQLQAVLDRLTLQNADQADETEALDETFEELLAHVKQLFSALGCDQDVIREQSGAENVLRTNVADCLALVDQRVEEYLLALARDEQGRELMEQEQQLLLQEDSDAAQQQLMVLRQQQHQQHKHSVARTFLRRADLLPRVSRGGEAVGNGGSGAGGLKGPYAGDPQRARPTESPSAKQLVARAKGGLPRSMDVRPGAATADRSSHKHTAHGSNTREAAASAATTPVVEADIPLSLEEMQRIVRERRGNTGNQDSDGRSFQ